MRSWAIAAFLFYTAAMGPLFSQSDSGESPAPENLTVLAREPQWKSLERYQYTITRSAFERLLYNYYSPDKAFCSYLDITSESVTVYRDKAKKIPLWTLYFLPPLSKRKTVPAYFPSRVLGELVDLSPQKPLEGLTICLDPGHIGGEWAQIEERSFQIKKDTPIEEGQLNLITCRHLADNLEKAGAQVVWTKKDYQPVTPLRPDDLLSDAITYALRKNSKISGYIGKPAVLKAIQWASELLFYRVAEIQARADKIYELKPDLTICLHYNAVGWSNPKRPVLYSYNGLLIFTNGNYLKYEIEYEDMKFGLMKKLLERTIGTEIVIGDSIGKRMKAHWPQWKASGFGKAGKAVGSTGYVWARNLLANRLYDGPVVFVEGPFMNNKDIYARLIEGDYEGTQLIHGKECKSIYREFADIVAAGVIDFYAKKYELLEDETWSPLERPSTPARTLDDGGIDEIPDVQEAPSPLMNLDSSPKK